MSSIKIVTDSTAYLPLELVAGHDIRVVPLKVQFGKESYVEGVDITNTRFYQELAQASTIPTTSQPSVRDFLEVYDELARRGHPVLSIHISSELSGTVSSALTARNRMPNAKIEVVDSLSAAMGLGMMALTAARDAGKGHSLPEIKAHVAKLTQSMIVLFVVDTLKYLPEGGRIGRASALVGSLLNINSILCCLKDGRVEVLAKIVTRGRALKRLLELMDERVAAGTPVHVAVMHAQAADEAWALEREIRSRFNCAEVYFSELGPVIGAHVGPGTVGLAFYGEQGAVGVPLPEHQRVPTNKALTALAGDMP